MSKFNKLDIKRNEFQLYGKQAKKGYDWWWIYLAIKKICYGLIMKLLTERNSIIASGMAVMG